MYCHSSYSPAYFKDAFSNSGIIILYSAGCLFWLSCATKKENNNYFKAPFNKSNLKMKVLKLTNLLVDVFNQVHNPVGS